MVAAGTQSVTTTAAAINNGVRAMAKQVLLQADPDNTADIFIGNLSSQPIQLKPGNTIVVPADDVTDLYVRAGSTQVLNWLSA